MLFKLFVKKIERALGGLSPARRIFLSFAGVIFIGSLLLSLPFVQASGSQATYFDHLFTTVSMVCVTGLFTQPVATTYNVWGQLICMLLIQIGGLGLMTFIGVFYIQGKQKLSLRSRETIQESFSYGETRSLKAFMRSIFLTTFLVEGLGAFLLSFRFIPEFGWGRGIFTSIFLAISAFCNAGFDNFGSSSLVAFQTDPLINLVIAGLIITGGLGFMVWFDLATQFDKKKSSQALHQKSRQKDRPHKGLQRLTFPITKTLLNGFTTTQTKLLLALDIKNPDKGHEPQTTNLYQEHTNQLPPDIIGSSHWLRKKTSHTDHGHRRKEMVKISSLRTTCLNKRQTQKKRTYKNNSSETQKNPTSWRKSAQGSFNFFHK